MTLDFFQYEILFEITKITKIIIIILIIIIIHSFTYPICK